MLIKYIRKNKAPIGIIVAIDRDKFGLSLCNKKDKWDKKLGLNIAIGRAIKGNIDEFLKKIKNEKIFEEVNRNLLIIEQLASKYDFNRSI